MIVFFYDATFEGLLSAVFDAYTGGVFPDALLPPGEIAPLTAAEPHTVITRGDKVERVFRGLEKKLSSFALSGLLYASLAEDAGMELFRYIRKVFDAPGRVEGNLADPDVLAVERLTRKVGREKHHLMGFARFQKTVQGVYLALVEPCCDVLPLLVPHFRERFGEQPWMLYDVRRTYGIFCDGERCAQAHLDGKLLRDGGLDPALLAEDEALFTRMWRQYFASAAIAERANPKLQARCLPRRFWKYLPEKHQ